MTAHTRILGTLALAFGAAASLAASAGAQNAPARGVVPPACAQALAYEKTAASDSVAAQARYDSAVAGLSANQGCRDGQMHLVNEAYLLSMRVPAEHDLHIGNWRQDVTRANMLLLQCSNWPGIKGTKAAIDCDTQRRYNVALTKTLDTYDRMASPAPGTSAAPGMRSPAPAASGRAAPPPPPQLSQPVGPNPSPSPTPRR